MANEAETGFVKALLAHQERMMRLLGIPVDCQKYLTGNWAVSAEMTVPPPFPLTADEKAAVLDEQIALLVAATAARYEAVQAEEASKLLAVLASRYPHTCPRCQGPAYVGAVEVDCAGGCK